MLAKQDNLPAASRLYFDYMIQYSEYTRKRNNLPISNIKYFIFYTVYAIDAGITLVILFYIYINGDILQKHC